MSQQPQLALDTLEYDLKAMEHEMYLWKKKLNKLVLIPRIIPLIDH